LASAPYIANLFEALFLSEIQDLPKFQVFQTLEEREKSETEVPGFYTRPYGNLS